MANPTLKDIVRVYGTRLLGVVEAEEKKHGPGALMVTLTDKLDVVHVAAKAFAAQKEVLNGIRKCHSDGDIFVMFKSNGTQELGVLTRTNVEIID